MKHFVNQRDCIISVFMLFSTLNLYSGNVKWMVHLIKRGNWLLNAWSSFPGSSSSSSQCHVCVNPSVSPGKWSPVCCYMGDRKKAAHESLGATQLVLTLVACWWECIIITTLTHMLSHCCAPWVFHTWNVLLPGLEKAYADTTSPHSNLKP